MPVKVIDASAIAAVIFSEPEADWVVGRIESYSLSAPQLLPFEIANVCLKKLRQHPKNREAILSAYALFSKIEIEEIPLPLGEVLLLAEENALTVYDAAYLHLAKTLNVELVTLDKAVQKAFDRL